MKVLLLLCSLFFTVHVFSFSPLIQGNFVDGDSFLGDSGIYGPSYNEQVNQMIELAKSYPNFVTYINYGHTLGNKALSGLLFAKKAPFKSKSLTLITGATHGNEYLNIVDQLPLKLINSKNNELMKYLNRGGSVFFVPIVNPDGYDRRRRSNNNFADLNRDWPNPGNKYREFRQPETRALSLWIEKYLGTDKKMSFAMDYHCCVEGMLLLPWGWKKNHYMNEKNRQKSKVYEDMMNEFFENPGRIGTPPDVLYSATGTTLDYWHEKYGAVSFTYEGRSRTENDLIENHVLWWNEILKSL